VDKRGDRREPRYRARRPVGAAGGCGREATGGSLDTERGDLWEPREAVGARRPEGASISSAATCGSRGRWCGWVEGSREVEW